MALFPLPLSPFEHCMLADDRSEYPMTFFLRMQFQGYFDHSRLERSLDRALLWHPLLKACIRGDAVDRTQNLFWIDSSPCRPALIWHSNSVDLLSAERMPIDLAREPGLRIFLREAAQSTEILAQFHHSCCDGLGALQFLRTLFEFYDGRSKDGPSEEWLAQHVIRDDVCRGSCGSTWRDRLRYYREELTRIGRYLRSRPSSLATPASPTEIMMKHTPFAGLVSHSFDGQETAQIRAAARVNGVSTNALLIRELFLALDGWNRNSASNEKGRSLRIVVPVSLREGPAQLPAMNAVSLTFVDRCPRELADSVGLLPGIAREIEVAKRLRRRMSFLPALRLLGNIPHGMSAALRWGTCLGSAVFTNLGLVFAESQLLGPDGLLRSGNVIMTGLEIAPPVRPGTYAGFAASMYGKALTLSLCYDGHRLTHRNGRNLLDRFVRRMQEFVERDVRNTEGIDQAVEAGLLVHNSSISNS